MQEGRAVLAGHPLHRRGHAEHVGAVARDGDDVAVGRGQLGPDRRAAAPAERAGAGGEEGPRLGPGQVVAHRREVGDALVQADGVGPDLLAQARHQIGHGNAALGHGLGGQQFRGAFGVGGGPVGALGLDLGLVDLAVLERGVELLQRRQAVGGVGGDGGQVPEGDVGLQRIDVDVADHRLGRGFVVGLDPRHVRVEHQDGVGLGQGRMLERLVPLHALIEVVVLRIVHGRRAGFVDPDPQPVAQAHELADRLGLAADVGGHHQRAPGGHQVVEDLGHGVFAQRRGLERRESRGRDLHRLGALLHHLARAGQVDGALGVALGELQGPEDHLLDVGAGAQLGLVLDVAAHDAALVRHVLQPHDELVAAALELALLGEGRQAREDQHRGAALGGVVDGAAEREGAGVHVHHHRLGLARHLGVALGGVKPDHLERGGDHLGDRPAVGARLGDRLQQGGVVGAEVAEDDRDTGFLQGFQEGGRGGVHGFPPVLPLGCTSGGPM